MPQQKQLDLKQAKKAVSALYKYQQNKKSDDLLETDQDAGIYIEINTHKVMNKAQLNKKRVALPVSPFADHIEICYITKDDEKTVEAKIKKESISEIKKVINIKNLESVYKSFEARRKLADSYDLFLVDNRVVQLMPTLLGKKFFEKNKTPVPIKATGALKSQVDKALKATYVKLHNGLTTRILIGNFSMSQSDLMKNYKEGVPEIVKIAAHDWKQVEILGIKSSDSPLLPIVTAFPTA